MTYKHLFLEIDRKRELKQNILFFNGWKLLEAGWLCGLFRATVLFGSFLFMGIAIARGGLFG